MARGYWDQGWNPGDDEAAFMRMEDAHDPTDDYPDARDIDFLGPSRWHQRRAERVREMEKRRTQHSSTLEKKGPDAETAHQPDEP